MIPQKNQPQRRTRDAKYEKYGNQEELEAEIERDAKILYQDKKLAKIEGFTNYYEFLTNDYPSEVYYKGYMYPTVSHAYNAARAPNEKMRNIIQKSPTLSSMYEFARNFEDPKDWAFKRIRVMETLIRDKFRRKRDLREKLASTANRELVHVTSDDTFWGTVNGKGQNQLGRILEQVRKDVIEDSELIHWLFFAFQLQEDKKSQPSVKLEVLKDNKSIENVVLEGKSFYLMGANAHKCDYVMEHPSISRVHACILHDQENGVLLLDLGSKAGTFLNGEKLKVCFPYTLKPGNQITFGLSSRKYQVSIDFSSVETKFEIEKKMFERELKQLEKLEDPNLDKNDIKEILGFTKQDTVYVGNLQYSVNESDLRDLFKGCGKIVSIRMPDDYQTRTKKGFAFITFDSETAAKQAKLRSGRVLYGRKIRVSIADKKPEIERSVRRELEKSKKWDEDEKHEIREDFENRHHDSKRRHRHDSSESSESEKRHRKHHKSRSRSRSRSHEKERRPKKYESESENESEKSSNSEVEESSSESSGSESSVSGSESIKSAEKKVEETKK